ncbi:MAG: amino acid permease [Gemmatimonas sp.]|jgi:APA family basic amino acid/polyamine antiporter|uniref:amino acid permease n=3 Tax=Gemmatimonas sp. TaxID=1962908 RepID=UPI00391F8121|nr:amino acid permease [Gemmatimonadota bacterium]
MGLWSKKSIVELRAQADSAEGGLKRSLGALNLTMLGIGAIIGAGIFVLTGTAAANFAGPGVSLSFVLAGLACLFAGLCYAEFASMIPIAGSAYTYSYATMGEGVAWFIGWNLVLEYLFAAATVSVGWSGYFSAMLASVGVHIPAAFASAPLTVVNGHEVVRAFTCVDPTSGVALVDAATSAAYATREACLAGGGEVVNGLINLPAVLLILALTFLLVRGVQESATFNNIVVAIKMIIVLLVIGFGFMYVNTDNWTPFIPEMVTNPDGSTKYGVAGVLRAAPVVFFSYIGFDAVSTAAQEAKNPQRDLPIGMIASLLICTVLYILMSLVMTGLAPYTALGVAHPVSAALEAVPQLKWLEYLVNIGAVAGLSSVVLVMLMGQPRIFYTMSRDGLLPKIFSRVHPTYQTPAASTWIVGIIAVVIAGFFPLGLLGELVSGGTLAAFATVCIGVWVLRLRSPELTRPFRTPLVPLVPILGAGATLYMMYLLPKLTWQLLAAWTAIGMTIYFVYGMRNSTIGQQEQQGR